MIEGLVSVATVQDLPERVDLATVYLPGPVTLGLTDELVAARPREVWLNPGADDQDVVQALKKRGLSVDCKCSIIALGFSPAEFPD